MRIYPDACAINRLTDDPIQVRVRMEAEAVRQVFRLIEDRRVEWVVSSILETELKRNPDMRRRLDALEMLHFADKMIYPDARIEARAISLHGFGYGRFDALHLAIAEAANADWMLTTDDRLLRQVHRGLGKPSVKTENPLDWIKEVQP